MPELVAFIAVGRDVDLLPHTLRHYAALGPDRILLSVHAGRPGEPVSPSVTECARAFGAEIGHVAVGDYAGTRARREATIAAACDAADWVMVADLDELHAYPRPVREIVAACEARGHDYVTGELVDRVAGDGGFPPIDARPLETQFPVAASLTANVCGGDVRKVVLARAGLRIAEGHHYALEGAPCPARELYVPVGHFKWDAGVFARARHAAASRLHPALPAADQWRRWERERFFRYVAASGGRLRLDDPLLEAYLPGAPPSAGPGGALPRRRGMRPAPEHPDHRRPVRPADATLEAGETIVRLRRAGRALESLCLDPAVVEQVWWLARGMLSVRQIRVRVREVLGRPAGEVDPLTDEALEGLTAAGAVSYR